MHLALLTLLGCLSHSTSKDIVEKIHPYKFSSINFKDKIFWVELKILRGEFFQNYSNTKYGNKSDIKTRLYR